MTRTFAVLAAILAVAPAARAADVLSELQACRSLADVERLACFDRVLARQDASSTAVSTPAAAPTQAAPAAAVATAKPATEFGAERLPQTAPDTPQAEESMVAKVASVRLNAFKQFTVVLDNGQVWRQLDSDTAVARFGAADTVKITRGFLDSYSLSVEGAYGTFRVKRIK